MRILALIVIGLAILVAEILSLRYLFVNLVHKRRPFLLPVVLLGILASLLLPYSFTEMFYLDTPDFGVYGVPFPSVFLQMENGMWLDYFGPLTEPAYYTNRIALALLPQVIAAVIFRRLERAA